MRKAARGRARRAPFAGRPGARAPALTAGGERGSMRGMLEQAKADSIIDLMCDGESLRSAAKQVGVKASTFLGWTQINPDLAERYARAFPIRAEAHAERIEAIVAKVESREIAPDQGRVMIDALKWTASKLHPQRFGDKIQVDQDLTMRIEVVDPTAIARVVASPALPSPAAAARLVASDDSDT